MGAAKEIKFQAYTLNIEHIPVEVLANTIQPFMDQYREVGVKELAAVAREYLSYLREANTIHRGKDGDFGSNDAQIKWVEQALRGAERK